MIHSTKLYVKKLYLFLFISNVLASSSNSRYQDIMCIDSEREALLKFKDGLIDEYARLSTWGHGKDCCKWTGIRCDNRTNHVISLDLHGADEPLTGKLSPSLLELSAITYIDLSNNNFNTKIPKFIGSLQKLQHLKLSNSFFFGLVPPHLGNLSMLKALDLSGNDMSAENLDWLSGFHSLRHLDLSGVNLEKAATILIPINKITRLKKLYMGGCSLQKPLPNSFPLVSNMSANSLMFLDLNYNNLTTSTLLWFLNFSDNYRHIDFSYNVLARKVLGGLAKQASLSYLDLSHSNFEADLPHEFLRESTMLEYLDLSNNQLYGSIPPLSRFPLLNTLSLTSNQLNGSFTDSKLRLPYLTSLDVSHNQLTGRLPDFSSCLSLRSLSLSENKFNGTLTETIGYLSKIPDLDLHSNMLEGVISEAHLFNLSNLQYLDLSSNSNLTIRISSDWNPPFQLLYLKLANCIIGPSFPKWLQNQKQLEYLDISSSQIYDTVPEWFWDNVHGFDYLNMSLNHIHGVIPDLLHLSTSTLDLSSNEFNGSLPLIHCSPVSSRVNHVDIYLSGNSFSGEINEFCNFTASMYDFYILDLSYNRLSGELSEECFLILQTLRHVNLGYNNFSGELPKANSESCGLSSLLLRNNSFRGHFPSVRNCSELISIDLGNNYFTGDIPTWVGESFPQLCFLILRSNEFSGILPSSLCFLTTMLILDISLNDISGTIPRCLQNWTSMMQSELTQNSDYHYIMYIMWKGRDAPFADTIWMVRAIDLSSNSLVGEIPSEITNLESLISLDLSRNHLVGTIPHDIDKLELLNFLDLSDNNLSGSIPTTLSNLNHLGKMNLSFNNLSGRIPWSTHSETFGSNAYLGNPQLCGPPLLRPCPGDQKPQIPKSTIHNDTEDNLNTFITKEFYISTAVGFILAFWGTFGILNFNKSCRGKFSKLLKALDDWWYVKIELSRRALRSYFHN